MIHTPNYVMHKMMKVHGITLSVMCVKESTAKWIHWYICILSNLAFEKYDSIV